MKNLLAITAAAAALTAAGPALAAGGGGEFHASAFSFVGPFGSFDLHQLLSGFLVYMEVCAAWHGVTFVPIRSLGEETGPACPEEQLKAIAANYEVQDEEGEPGDTRPAKPSDNFPANNSAGAP
ncbi:MAG: cytochrome c1, partial [Pikeienuella sp.]